MGRNDMERVELRAWLRLVLTPRLGPGGARKLLAALGSPQAVISAPAHALAALLPQREVAELAKEPEGLDAQVEATLDWLQAPGHHLLSLADPRYPRALLEAPDPPLLLFAQGDLGLLDRPAVAVVGSRHPTPQGRDNAHAFAKALSQAGVTVVSGLALGVDGAAHEGALAAAGDGGEAAAMGRPAGSTIAVVGTGLDIVYPKAHQALGRRLAAQGLLLSEFLLGTQPLQGNFPKRNRIVAALSRGTLVVEAAVQSGSLITARLAAEIGREVLAIPGSIHAPQSRGCHALIKQGAKLVETAQDVLEELRLDALPPARAPGQGERAGAESAHEAGDDEAHGIDPVLAAMGYDPVSQEALSARTGYGPAELGARLLELELMGLVARLPGQLFQRVMAA
jgi:DNA processing protein